MKHTKYTTYDVQPDSEKYLGIKNCHGSESNSWHAVQWMVARST